VDDEGAIRTLLKEVFESEGYHVKIAPDAFEALDMIKSFDFDLVLTDIKMPGMSGLELIKEAEKIKKNLVFMIITGYASIESAQAAVKYGVYDYISKPFDISYVKMAVSRALERKRLFDENTRLRELAKLFSLTESISTTLEKTRLSKLLLHSSITYTGSEGGAIFIFTGDEENGGEITLDEWIAGGTFQDVVSISPEDFGKKVLRLLSGLGKAIILSSHDTVDSRNVRVTVVKDGLESWGLPGDVRALLVPVMRLDRLHAGIVLVKSGRPFTLDNLELVSIIASQGAVAFENANLITSLKDAYISMIESLILIVEAKDSYTYGHSRRVSNLCVRLARKLGIPEKEVETLRLAANLHDIGKISVPEGILNKPGKPDDEEWLYIKRHTLIGDEVLKPLKFLDEAREIIRYHHERYDGRGYPHGLKGDDIPLLTRIMTVADAYDAMSSVRAYRKPLTREEIKRELLENAGKQFDPEIVRAMIEIMEEEGEER